jgi:hypothetical protein
MLYQISTWGYNGVQLYKNDIFVNTFFSFYVLKKNELETRSDLVKMFYKDMIESNIQVNVFGMPNVFLKKITSEEASLILSEFGLFDENCVSRKETLPVSRVLSSYISFIISTARLNFSLTLDTQIVRVESETTIVDFIEDFCSNRRREIKAYSGKPCQNIGYHFQRIGDQTAFKILSGFNFIG